MISEIAIKNSQFTNFKTLSGKNFKEYVLQDYYHFNLVYFYDSSKKTDMQLLEKFKKFSESSTSISYLKFGVFDLHFNELTEFVPKNSCVVLFNHETIKPFSFVVNWESEEDLMSMLIPNLNADLEKRKEGYHKWYYPFDEYKSEELTRKMKKNNVLGNKAEDERRAAMDRASTGVNYHVNLATDL